MPGDFFHGHGAAWETWAMGPQEWSQKAFPVSVHSLAATVVVMMMMVVVEEKILCRPNARYFLEMDA